MGIQPKRGLGRSHRPLTREQIITAQEQTRSAAEAARYLHVNYMTYRKYAEIYGIFKKNPSGKGVVKIKQEGQFGLDAILANQHPNYDRTKLKQRLIRAGYFKEECSLCKYGEKRILDGQVPLVLSTIDRPDDLRLKNLRLLCYNCMFITSGVISKKAAAAKGWKTEQPKQMSVADPHDILHMTDAEELEKMMAEIRQDLHEGLTD